ncbi:MAG: hypothetical protein JNM36_13025 [Chitinophagales bacterium]|nr:hypothetical protein [Chitinophagales bacterium]
MGGLGQHTTARFWEYDTWAARRLELDPIDIPNVSPYSVFGGNPISNNDVDGDSPISFFAQRLAKAGLKKATKEFIEYEIKLRLKSYASKQWAKQLVKDADGILEAYDTEWWEYVVELIPVAGDVYGGYTFTKQSKEVWDRLSAIQNKMENILQASKHGQRFENIASRLGGKVIKSTHGASDMAKAYESQIGGLAEGLNLSINGVDFDGVGENGVLREAKGKGYTKLIKRFGIKEFTDKWVKQADRQLKALPKGETMEWHFEESEAASAATEVFKKEFGNRIKVVHTPQEKFPTKKK